MPTSTRRIMIIEDSPTMTQLYRIVLGQEEGRELVFAANGLEGLDLAAQEPDVDLFIVDINMPYVDGLEFLRRLRGELGVTETPAVVVSTEGEEADREAALAAGANAFLRKPWKPAQLLDLVRSLSAAAP
ncbi:MAG TPA: response regulator [Longimicrobiaceae bacterium]|nr:response regulator [Longimicrobiaceae bacterium]